MSAYITLSVQTIVRWSSVIGGVGNNDDFRVSVSVRDDRIYSLLFVATDGCGNKFPILDRTEDRF